MLSVELKLCTCRLVFSGELKRKDVYLYECKLEERALVLDMI